MEAKQMVRFGGAVVMAVCVLVARAEAVSFTIPESKLLGPEFAQSAWGAASSRQDAAGAWVEFSFASLGTANAGLKDNYPVDTVYGQKLPSHANGDFSGFDGFSLQAMNAGTSPIWISLFINTGFTGPSGVPSNTPANDTFWQSVWRLLAPGERTVLELDFDNAIPFHVEDNPLPHTQGGTDGVAMAINPYDRTELDAIGFHVYSDVETAASVLIAPYGVVPEPSPLLLFFCGAAFLYGTRRSLRTWTQ